jgi:hypothetical protein
MVICALMLNQNGFELDLNMYILRWYIILIQLKTLDPRRMEYRFANHKNISLFAYEIQSS